MSNGYWRMVMAGKHSTLFRLAALQRERSAPNVSLTSPQGGEGGGGYCGVDKLRIEGESHSLLPYHCRLRLSLSQVPAALLPAPHPWAPSKPLHVPSIIFLCYLYEDSRSWGGVCPTRALCATIMMTFPDSVPKFTITE